MRQSIIFIFLFVFPAICHSQVLITGTVVDSRTKEPVEIVYVKNKNQYKYITFSKEDGSFSIYANVNDTIEFHRINYEAKIIVVKNDENMIVEMRPKTYMLDEVVVTFEDASDIYTKAVNNLRNKYLKGVSVYLWHGAESRNSENSESFAMYSAKFDFNKSKRSHSFDLRLMALNHLSEPNKKPVLSALPFHPVNLRQVEKEDRGKFIKVNSEDDSLIFLQQSLYVEKLKETVPVDIVINKEDTVLLYIKSSAGGFVKDLKILG
ncbi:MAG: carboxypeptidase-like regulatory domain-containing protein, partial [Tannerella sp.]|nr:carboxypeptidase-like regulatory domain-containing protein [Tannerella sp.]